ncbi:MAG TPA: 2-oxoglutarate dehydrogenase E1 component, partial [Acidobacteriota bacterium]|nr:2-oxoglutarate dehydrogenase E1 component [Acidobacteriota bacterium]
MSKRGKETDRERVLEAFRRFGFLRADLDALGRLAPLEVPELDLDGELADEARRIYCGPIGIEFMHIPDAERREWIGRQMESEPEEIDVRRVLRWLMRADLFEHFLQSRYLGNKRFSIEGVESLIPLLKEIFETAAENEAERIILAMTHRGRLNVMFQVVGRPAEEILSGFEDTDPKSFLGAGDVKYHLGATGTFQARNGRELSIHLVSNPSHLEAVDPVAMGRARAWQTRLGDDGPQRVVPIVLHGDAAFAGQGILAEVLNLADLPGFSVGGTVQIVVNNLIGFTALPEELHSSRFATDVAKRIPIPIIHVNAAEPDAVIRAARLAGRYRAKFRSDVVVDLIGFRRFGHSEVDDPTITQPLLYRKIKKSPPLWKSYAERIGADTSELEEEVRQELDRAHEVVKSLEKRPLMRVMPEYWSDYVGGFYDPKFEVATGLSRDRIRELSKKVSGYPRDFHVHEKVKKLLEQRLEMGEGKRPVDFGMAEALAFASLLEEGLLVRLSGQDSRRATFNQRHAVLIDAENEREYIPLQHVSPDQGRFEVYDSMLSEAAVLGFEYGFSRDFPDGLVLWEAQFGDFANGAQVIIDQFIAAGEDKWNLLSGLVMLLPHGYEGQGPEHSSARLERYLQLAAEDNMQVCQPSSAA